MVAGVVEHCLGTLRSWSATARRSTSRRRLPRVQLHRGAARAGRARSPDRLRRRDARGAARGAGRRAEAAELSPAAGCRTRSSRPCVEPHLIQPTFVLDYPKALSPLAKEHRDGSGAHRAVRAVRRRPRAGQRLQRAQRSRRPAAPVRGPGAAARRGRRGSPQLDADYIRALEYGMPPAGGVGLASIG